MTLADAGNARPLKKGHRTASRKEIAAALQDIAKVQAFGVVRYPNARAVGSAAINSHSLGNGRAEEHT